MNYSEFYKIEQILKKQKINCFVDPNRWEVKDGYVIFFHKITHAKKSVEYFTKLGIGIGEILPNVLNAYFKYRLLIFRGEKLEEWLKENLNDNGFKGGLNQFFLLHLTDI